MKKYAIGLITGALLAISAMMFMGATNNENSTEGRYQYDGTGYLLDTRDATLYYYKIVGMSMKKGGGQWIRISAEEPFK